MARKAPNPYPAIAGPQTAQEMGAQRNVATQLDNRMQIAAALYVDMGCKRGSYVHIAKVLDVTIETIHNMMLRPRMQAHIRHLLTQRFNQLELSSERVMHELATIGFIKVSDLYDENGDLYEPWMLPDHVAAAVQAVEIEKRVELNGRRSARTEDDPYGEGEDGRAEITTKKYKFHPKIEALKTLAQHYKIIGGTDEGVNALASALADKLKAARGRLPTPPPEQPIEDATIVTPSGTIPEPPTQTSQEISDEEPIW